MTKPRRKQTKAERDQAPVAGKTDRQRDMPGRFRLVMAMQKQMEQRDQQKKAAKKAGKPVPKPKSSESLPPPTHVRPTAADDPAASGKKKGGSAASDVKEASSSNAKSSDSKPSTSKAATGKSKAAAAEADDADSESKLSASARRRKRRLEAEVRVAKEEMLESTEPSRKRPRKQEFDELEDAIRFGEVAQAPPTLKVSKKMQKRKMERILADEVAQNAVKTSGGKSAAEKRQMDDERNRMIQLYRDLKAKRDMDRAFPSLPGRM